MSESNNTQVVSEEGIIGKGKMRDLRSGVDIRGTKLSLKVEDNLIGIW